MTLKDLRQGHTAVIRRLAGGRGFIQRLNGFGLHPGSRIALLRAAPFQGPLLLEDLRSGTHIMVGRGMADRIEIEEVTDGAAPG